jgi:hypothetical protein
MSTTTTTTKKAAPAKVELPSNLNVSQTIRYLHDEAKLTRGDIVRYFETHLDRTIRYQHVRNVLITPVKKK